MNKTKILETSLVITTGFLVIYFLTSIKAFLLVALTFGLIGILIKPLAKYVAILWFKLADALNFVVSKIVLGTIFFLVLFPISLLYRISKNDKLQIRKSKSSLWTIRNYKYKSADLENIW